MSHETIRFYSKEGEPLKEVRLKKGGFAPLLAGLAGFLLPKILGVGVGGCTPPSYMTLGEEDEMGSKIPTKRLSGQQLQKLLCDLVVQEVEEEEDDLSDVEGTAVGFGGKRGGATGFGKKGGKKGGCEGTSIGFGKKGGAVGFGGQEGGALGFGKKGGQEGGALGFGKKGGQEGGALGFGRKGGSLGFGKKGGMAQVIYDPEQPSAVKSPSKPSIPAPFFQQKM
jgi:hypothetical protein